MSSPTAVASRTTASAPSDGVAWWRWATLGALFVVALAVRIPGLDAPNLGYFPTRQFHSA